MEIKIIHSEDKILITDDNGESVTISFDEYVVNSELSLLEIKDKFYGKNKIHILSYLGGR
jgi:hypothetical protein